MTIDFGGDEDINDALPGITIDTKNKENIKFIIGSIVQHLRTQQAARIQTNIPTNFGSVAQGSLGFAGVLMRGTNGRQEGKEATPEEFLYTMPSGQVLSKP